MKFQTNKIPFIQNIYSVLAFRIASVMLIFSVSRILFYLYNISYFPEMEIAHFLYLMLGGLRFDLTAILYTNFIFILLQLLPFKFRHTKIYQKVTLALFYITNSLIIAINLADIAYYQFTLKRTTASVFQQFENETNLGTLFFQFLIDFWQITFATLILIAVLIYSNKKITVGNANIIKNWHYFFINLIVSAAFVILLIIGIRSGYDGTSRPLNMSNASEYINNPNETAIVLNTPFSLYLTFSKKALEKKNYFAEQELKTIYSAYHKADTTNNFQNKNVVIFILESFGRENIGALNKDIKGYKGFTPFLDSLIGQSYTHKYSFANGRKSIEALPSVTAGIPSLVTSYILSHYSSNKINTLANTLSKKGYYSAFFHGAPNTSMGFKAFTTLAGFDDYFGKDEYNNDDDFDGYWGIWDEEFFQFFAHKMNTFKQPFFTTLFSVSSHHPYVVPEKYKGKFPEGNLELHRTIGYTDFALKQFFEKAKKMEWFKNTIFVITADHAATFSDLKEYKTSSGFFAVPVIIYEPSTQNWKGFNDSTVMQQIDIMPTILGYLKYDHEYISFGSDIKNTQEEHFSVSYLVNVYQVVMGDFILQYDEKEVVSLYNIKEDKLLKKNLKGKYPEIEEKILKKLKAFIQEHNQRLIDNQTYID